MLQNDSSNSGATGAFTTGNGAPALPFGTAIAAGTPYGWETEFDNGYALAGEVGAFYDNGFRSGIELVYSKADVDTHSGVNVAGTVIDGVDAAVQHFEQALVVLRQLGDDAHVPAQLRIALGQRGADLFVAGQLFVEFGLVFVHVVAHHQEGVHHVAQFTGR